MTKEFVPYKLALALKELGFDEPCFAHFVKHYDEIKCILNSDDFDEWWTNNSDNLEVKAPLYQQAFRWFRDKHSFIGIPTISNYSDDRYVFDIFQKGNEEIYFEGSDLSDRNNGNKEYNTYEEAESACLIKLIEIVKNK